MHLASVVCSKLGLLRCSLALDLSQMAGALHALHRDKRPGDLIGTAGCTKIENYEESLILKLCAPKFEALISVVPGKASKDLGCRVKAAV